MLKYITSLILCIALSSIHLSAQTVYKSQARNSSTSNKNIWNGERDYSRFSTQNIIYSGNIAFNFYGDVLNFGVSPIVGYKFNDYLSAGIRFGYNYWRLKNYNYFVDANNQFIYKPLRNDYYQVGLWTRISPIELLYAHVEYEQHYLVQKKYVYGPSNSIIKQKENFSINSLMVGGGLKQNISDRISYCMTILYDVLQNTEKNSYTDPTNGKKYSLSPYANTIDVRFGIYVNF